MTDISLSAFLRKALLPAVVSCLATGCSHAAAKEGSFPLAGAAVVRLTQDKGELVLRPGGEGRVDYKVEFSGRFWSPESEGRLEVDPSGTMTILAGAASRAKVTVSVPAGARVELKFGDGSVAIGPLSGPVYASVANGKLSFDPSALPSGGCASVKVLNGSARTPWGERSGAGIDISPCKEPAARLEVVNGLVTVR